jgi:hypothetical protein
MKAADAAKIIQEVCQSASQEVIGAITKATHGSVRTLVKLIGKMHNTMRVNRLEVPYACELVKNLD